MKEYKNIDELFKEGISGFSPSPSDKVWAGIEKATIGSVATKNTYFSNWAIAAIVLLFVGATAIMYFTFSGDNNISSKINNQNIVVETPNSNINKNQNISKQNKDLNNETKEFSNDVKLISSKEVKITIDEISEKIIIDNFIKSTDEVNFAENGVLESTVFASNNIKETESLLDANYDIQNMNSRSIYEIAYLDNNMIDRQINIEEYLKKRKKFHSYTALAIKAAMAYYPNTQDQFTYSAEANYGLVLNKFYIETGIGFQHMKERGIYKYTYKSKDSIGFYNRVVSFDFNPFNPDDITYKTSKTTVYDSIVHINEEAPLFNYTYLNIPLKLGYRIWEKDKLSLGLETGLIFSKMLSKEIPTAVFNNTESSLLKIDDDTPQRVDLNMQMLLAIRFNYKFSKAISISLQPEFTKYLNSIYDTKIGDPNIKPYTMGLKFGIYYDF